MLVTRTRRLLSRLSALSWKERLAVVRLTMWAVAIEIAVRILSLPRLARALRLRMQDDEFPNHETEISQRHRQAETRAKPVDRFYRHWPIGDYCLRRALVLGRELRDLDPVLRIGVAREDGTVKAHAWVEVDGKAVGGEGGTFAPLRRARHR